jgi:hypothetical protein
MQVLHRLLVGTLFILLSAWAPLQPLNAEISKHNFIYAEKDSAYLKKFYSKYKLGKLVTNAKSDIEKTSIVSTWVHSLWKHDSWQSPGEIDPIAIIEESKRGKGFRCVEYSKVLFAALSAIGFKSRMLYLKTEDVERRVEGAGHVGVEVFLEEAKKWAYVDAQWNVFPQNGGRPLSAIELRELIKIGEHIWSFTDIDKRALREFEKWITPYLYYFQVYFDNRVIGTRRFSLMLIPEGARKPHVFQRVIPLRDIIYTNSKEVFYESPF